MAEAAPGVFFRTAIIVEKSRYIGIRLEKSLDTNMKLYEVGLSTNDSRLDLWRNLRTQTTFGLLLELPKP
jgi:hypothetical protein